MRPDQKTWLEGYITEVQGAMSLSHWNIILSDDPADPDTYAQIKPTVCRDTAVLRVADVIFDQSPGSIRNSVVHELIHCILEPVRWVMLNAANELSRSAAVIVEEEHHDAMELATDRLAKAAAAAVPLPESIPT